MDNRKIAELASLFEASVTNKDVRVRDTLHSSMYTSDTPQRRGSDHLFFSVTRGEGGILKMRGEQRTLFQRSIIGSIPSIAFGRGGLMYFLRDQRESSLKTIRFQGVTRTIAVQVPLRNQFLLDEVKHLLPSLVPRAVQDYVLVSVGYVEGIMVFQIEGVVSRIFTVRR